MARLLRFLTQSKQAPRDKYIEYDLRHLQRKFRSTEFEALEADLKPLQYKRNEK